MRRAACGIGRDQEGSTRHGNANWNWHRNWHRAVSDRFDFRQSQFVAIPNFDKPIPTASVRPRARAVYHLPEYSKHLARNILLHAAKPVMFPLGGDKFLTRPPMNGSAADAVTMGMVALAAAAALTATVPSVTMISTPDLRAPKGVVPKCRQPRHTL
jgi:hypothetical protein